MSYFPLNDSLSLFYTTHGDPSNEPFLLIHGWCCDGQDWAWQIPFLEKTYYVVVLDNRGHGRSSAPTDISYSAQDMAADAAALLRHLKIQKTLVMGHSMGGVATSTLAITEPQLVKAIILNDPAYWLPKKIADAALLAWYDPNADIHALTLGAYSALYGESSPAHQKALHSRRVQGTPAHVSLGSIIGLCDGVGLGTMENSLEYVKGRRNCPTLVYYVKQELADGERAMTTGEKDEIVVMEGVGHWPHQEKSEEYNEILGRWLKKIESS
ncbi:alpha/beta-hydrolase [Amniculicola lignicola CBS 123094]|uniref:Alpha/beta-hydrolase n=1 Tax=Amniculicola lignicola CBS 123094 TaxID=1392246 RepID=A0A6A5X159_9PLEO|nr:alpha/beta-hydrolase [Amniculicola lignicola CBS 123094]